VALRDGTYLAGEFWTWQEAESWLDRHGDRSTMQVMPTAQAKKSLEKDARTDASFFLRDMKVGESRNFSGVDIERPDNKTWVIRGKPYSLEGAAAYLAIYGGKSMKSISVSLAFMKKLCPHCAAMMERKGWKSVKMQLGKDISPEAVQGLCGKFSGHTACIDHMEGKVDDAGAFCNWLMSHCKSVKIVKAKDSDEWWEGYDAEKNGVNGNSNPYPKGSTKWRDWDDGWHQAAHEDANKSADTGETNFISMSARNAIVKRIEALERQVENKGQTPTAEEIMRSGQMIGHSLDDAWELWQYRGQTWNVNTDTGKVTPSKERPPYPGKSEKSERIEVLEKRFVKQFLIAYPSPGGKRYWDGSKWTTDKLHAVNYRTESEAKDAMQEIGATGAFVIAA
jgi:hypothetical protein